jgi:hypothetical protein
MRRSAWIALSLAALGAAGGCNSAPPVGDAPNTGQAITKDQLPPQLQQRRAAREGVFGTGAPPGVNPSGQ